MIAAALCLLGAAHAGAQSPGTGGSTTSISTSQFVNQFDAEPTSYSPATVTAAQISDYTQMEDLQTGTVTTSGVWTSPSGRKASFQYQVFSDLAREHVAVVSLSLTPQWHGNRE